MTKYTDRYTAPLLFHKLMNYLFLPLTFLFAVERLVMEHAILFSGNWIAAVDACSVFATLLLSALAFVGLLAGSPKTRPLFHKFHAFKTRLLGNGGGTPC